MYYQWKRTLVGAADRIFEQKESKPTAREQRLAAENARLKSVVVEITTENLELKKRFRPGGSWPDASGTSAASPCAGTANEGAERVVGEKDSVSAGHCSRQ